MTQEEALEEARRRWGQRSQIFDYGENKLLISSSRVIVGMGSTWEAAFADADRRAAQEVKKP